MTTRQVQQGEKLKWLHEPDIIQSIMFSMQGDVSDARDSFDLHGQDREELGKESEVEGQKTSGPHKESANDKSSPGTTDVSSESISPGESVLARHSAESPWTQAYVLSCRGTQYMVQFLKQGHNVKNIRCPKKTSSISIGTIGNRK